MAEKEDALMQRPDFTDAKWRIVWTAERIAYVRHLAEDRKMSARDIALDIGLSAATAPRINATCRRFDIQLTGQAGRPAASGARYHRVKVAAKHGPLLEQIARAHDLLPADVAALLIDAVCEQGEAFCKNMLDLGA